MTLHVQLRQKQCVHPESKPLDSIREISKIQYYKCQVRGSFCEISEEYDVNPDYTVVAS